MVVGEEERVWERRLLLLLLLLLLPVEVSPDLLLSGPPDRLLVSAGLVLCVSGPHAVASVLYMYAFIVEWSFLFSHIQ